LMGCDPSPNTCRYCTLKRGTREGVPRRPSKDNRRWSDRREYYKEYYAKNKERLRARQVAWENEHREQRNKYKREHRNRNKDGE
jgi:hypothetical protein